jgi:DNA-binding MarR family transcriptional regulator
MATSAPPESDGPMSLLFDIWLVSGLMAGLLEDVLAESELNGDDFGMYSLMRRYGPATPTQLRRWTGLPLTTISAHLKRLEKRGHLTRSPNPTDGRSHRVGLSAAGEAAHDAATEPFLAAMHTLRARFVPDTLRERLVLQGLDAVLREALALDDRPYRVQLPADDDTHHGSGAAVLAYPGAPLSSAEEQQVRLYIDFLRTQGTQTTPGAHPGDPSSTKEPT